MADDRGSKTKLLLSLKSEVIELKLSTENDKQQIDKLSKKFTQLGPVLEEIKDSIRTEVKDLKQELSDEKATRGKMMSWYCCVSWFSFVFFNDV